jgi:hypothetical protein
MQDRPTAEELLEAARRFLEHDVVPQLDGPRQFHARVAANVLAIVAREIAVGDAHLREEWRRLHVLLPDDGDTGDAPPAEPAALASAVRAMNAALVARIRAGDADRGDYRTAVLTHLRATADDKLRIANPRWLEAGR